MKDDKLKERLRKLTKKEELVCFYLRKKEENECGREELVIMCEKMFVKKRKLCENKENGRKLCVTNSCSGVHGRISMNKPLDSCLK